MKILLNTFCLFGIFISSSFAVSGKLVATLPSGSPTLDYTSCKVYQATQVSDVDAQGNFSFTVISTQDLGSPDNHLLMGNRLSLTTSNRDISFSVSNLSGSTLWKSHRTTSLGSSQFFITKNYQASPGVYFLTIVNGKQKWVLKTVYPISTIHQTPQKQTKISHQQNTEPHIEESGKITFVCRGYIPAVAEVDFNTVDFGQVPATFQKPNVLFIMSDDLSDYVGFMKNKPALGDGQANAKTPYIDALASGGVKFMNAHTQAPLCGPARTSMLYGLYPSTTGVYLHPDSATYVNIKNVTMDMIDYFNTQGYKTMGQGKVNHGRIPLNFTEGTTTSNWGPSPKPPISYDESHLVYSDGRVDSLPGKTATDWGYWDAYGPVKDSLDKTDMPDYQVASFAINQLSQTHNKPFMMSIGFIKPHNPWINPWEYNDRYPLEELELPSILANDWDDIPQEITNVNTMVEMPPFDWMMEPGKEDERPKGILQSYLGSVSFADDQVGRVMEALNASPYKDNTIVVFASDHGYHMGEKRVWQKQSLWRESTRIPFVISIPNMPNLREVNTPVGLIDIYPTLLDLCGFPANPKNEGLSLAEHLYNPASTLPRKTIRTTWGRGNHSLMSETHQYVKVSRGGQDYEELYNFMEDPNEHTNLTGAQYDNIRNPLKADLPVRSQESPWKVGITPEGKFDP